MKNKIIWICFIVLASSLSLSQCASRNTLSQMNFGVKAAEKQLWDEAVFRWKKVLEISPRSAAAHNNLAVAYEKKGMWEEARKEYKLALEIDPENEYIQSNYKNFQSNHSEENEEKKEKSEKNEIKKQ